MLLWHNVVYAAKIWALRGISKLVSLTLFFFLLSPVKKVGETDFFLFLFRSQLSGSCSCIHSEKTRASCHPWIQYFSSVILPGEKLLSVITFCLRNCEYNRCLNTSDVRHEWQKCWRIKAHTDGSLVLQIVFWIFANT